MRRDGAGVAIHHDLVAPADARFDRRDGAADGARPHPFGERLGIEPRVEEVLRRSGNGSAHDDGGGREIVSNGGIHLHFPFLDVTYASRAASLPSQKRRYFSIQTCASASGPAFNDNT